MHFRFLGEDQNSAQAHFSHVSLTQVSYGQWSSISQLIGQKGYDGKVEQWEEKALFFSLRHFLSMSMGTRRVDSRPQVASW